MILPDDMRIASIYAGMTALLRDLGFELTPNPHSCHWQEEWFHAPWHVTLTLVKSDPVGPVTDVEAEVSNSSSAQTSTAASVKHLSRILSQPPSGALLPDDDGRLGTNSLTRKTIIEASSEERAKIVQSLIESGFDENILLIPSFLQNDE